jgi:Flp pilus assembly protein TadD/outer membrane protein OmpA-like peptidoglycan-associated protein
MLSNKLKTSFMMNSNSIKSLSLILGVTLGLSSCDGLGKMIKNQNKITYEVKPNPLEMHGDSVSVAISGKYPAKLFAKKAVVTVTPILTADGNEVALKQVVLVGEKAKGAGQKISYSKGGTFSYTDKIAYNEKIKNSKLAIKASGQVKTKKPKDFKNMEIGDATVVTPLLVRNDEKGVFAKDNFVKVIPMNQSANIFYTINQSSVRPAELKSDEMKNLMAFINTNQNNTMWYDFKGVEVNSYASPDGKSDRNAKLSEDRGKSGSKALEGQIKKPKKGEAASPIGDAKTYKAQNVAEDWDGFKRLMEASAMKDKDLVVRVLSMYNDDEQREREIKNMAMTYKEIKDQILPKLRRSVLTLLVDKKSRTDEMIAAMMVSTPDSLSIEELLYGATLTNDINTKASVYKATEKKYPNDWRASSNYGVTMLMQNKVSDAKAAFERAAKIAPNEPIVNNGLGIIAAKNKDRKAAMDYYKKAAAAGSEVSYNMGVLDILNGNYSEAVAHFGTYKGINLALAQLLNGQADAVNSTIDASNEKDLALAHYLKAVAAARKGDNSAGLASLKSAIEKDGSFKKMAKEDAEFIKWRSDAGFTALTN